MSVAGPILKLRPSNFAKSYNFYRCINDISMTFWYLKWFQIYKKSHPTSYPVLESSLPSTTIIAVIRYHWLRGTWQVGLWSASTLIRELCPHTAPGVMASPKGLTRLTSGIVQTLWRPFLTSRLVPVLKPSSNSVLPVAWITKPATDLRPFQKLIIGM